MDILWLSANKLGYELLREAVKLEGFDLKGIITLSERSKTIMYDGIPPGKWGKFGVRVFELENLSFHKALIEKMRPDLIVMCGWRQILDGSILNLPKQGVIGFHPTLLPYGRGPAPIINTILKGITTSGLTMFYAARGLDSGDIIAQDKFRIKETDHAEDIYKKVIRSGRKLIRAHLPLIIQKKASRFPQDASEAVVFKKPKININRIDLENETLEQAYRKIKALSKPYKGAYIEKDNRRLVIWRAELKDIK